MARTWFITGTSRGFGREWAEAALERGGKVAATGLLPYLEHEYAARMETWTGWQNLSEAAHGRSAA